MHVTWRCCFKSSKGIKIANGTLSHMQFLTSVQNRKNTFEVIVNKFIFFFYIYPFHIWLYIWFDNNMPIFKMITLSNRHIVNNFSINILVWEREKDTCRIWRFVIEATCENVKWWQFQYIYIYYNYIVSVLFLFALLFATVCL